MADITPQLSLSDLKTLSEILVDTSINLCRPLILVTYPEQSQTEAKPVIGNELRPNCNGVVVAIACTDEEAQDLVNMIDLWTQKKGDHE